MTKHRKTKRRQRGGGLFDWFSSSGSSSEPGMYEKTKNMFSGLFSQSNTNTNTNTVDPYVQPQSEQSLNIQPQSTEYNSDQNALNQDMTNQVITNEQYNNTGGRRSRRRHKKMKGGKGNLGLVYYATPVSGIKVVEPTFWINGGSRKRRHTRRHKKK